MDYNQGFNFCFVKQKLIEDITLRETEFKGELPGVVRPKLNWETVRI